MEVRRETIKPHPQSVVSSFENAVSAFLHISKRFSDVEGSFYGGSQ